MPRQSNDRSFIALARVTKPIGLKGGVRVQILCDRPERLMEADHVFRGVSAERATSVTLREVSVRGNGVVVFFEDCADREAAEAIRDAYLFVPVTEDILPDDGDARVHELIGAAVVTATGTIVGTVTNVYDLPSHRVIGVTPGGGTEEVLVPYVDAWVSAFDRAGRRIEITSDELFRGV